MQIVDIISTKAEKVGIIVCKYFSEIHSELLENFYSYVQQNNLNNIDIKFMFLTEELSFIPENILHCCEVIHMERPTKSQYKKCLEKSGKNECPKNECPKNECPKNVVADFDPSAVTNIKLLNTQTVHQGMIPHKIICDKIVHFIVRVEDMKFIKCRDYLYDIFIYHLDITECVYYILESLFSQNKIKQDAIPQLMIKLYTFLQYFNNNYRTIYHLESFVYHLIYLVHQYS